MSGITFGRLLFTFNALFTILSPYAADWNVTHIYNPRWPPHAKFHNGQTMAIGVIIGLATLFFTWRNSQDRTEPPRVGRRLRLLRGWSLYEQDDEQVCA